MPFASLRRAWGSQGLSLGTFVYHVIVSYPMQLLAIPVGNALPRTVPLPMGRRIPTPHFLQLLALSLIIPFAMAIRSARNLEAALVVALFHYFNQFDTAVYRRMIQTGRIAAKDCPRVQLYSDVVARVFVGFGTWTFASSRALVADAAAVDGGLAHAVVVPAAGWEVWAANTAAVVLMMYNIVALLLRIEDAHPQPPATGAAFARIGGFGVPFGISALGKLRELVDSLALATLCAAFDTRTPALVASAVRSVPVVRDILGNGGGGGGEGILSGGPEASFPFVMLATATAVVAVALNNDHVTHKLTTERALEEASRKVVSTLAPQDPSLSQPRKDTPEFEVVYTIGCFDLFHAGHVKLMQRLRQHGRRLVVGIHDDESILLLKGRFPIDNTVRRARNVKRYADVVFVIPSTDPSPYLDGVVDRSVPKDKMCYMRGSDMPQFPGRQIAEQLMMIRLFPYTEGVSTSLLRKKLFERRKSVDNEDAARAAAAQADDDATFIRCNGEWIDTSLEPEGIAWVRSGHDYYKFVTATDSPTIQ